MNRREFPRKIVAAILIRATDEHGRLVCEGCGGVLGKKRHHIDHTVAEALVIDKSKPLTADDGKLLGWECCHKPKTAIDVANIRKSDRQRDKHSGAFKRSARPLPCGRNSPFKKLFSGEVVRR